MELLPKANWQAIVVFATVLSFAIGATWQVRDKQSEQRIQQCIEELSSVKGAKDWQLPETLRSLKSVSDSVRVQIGERKELDDLRSEVKRLREDAAKHATQLAAEQKAAADCKAQLDKAFATQVLTFELQEGEGREIIPGLLTVAVRSVSNYTSTAIVVNGQKHDMSVGESTDVDVAGKHCSVTLIKVAGSAAKLISRCK